MNRLAVVAHYDVDRTLDAYLQPLIEQLAAVCSRVVIVTTSGIGEIKFSLPKNVQLLERENEGYDWCSFKRGLEVSQPSNTYDEIILTNDSYYTTERFSVSRILKRTKEMNAAISGISENEQFSRHIQSYFLVFQNSSIPRGLFSEFWSRVYPINNKLSLVLAYEVGLTQLFSLAGLRTKALFRPSLAATIKAKLRALRRSVSAGHGVRESMREVLAMQNPTYVFFRELERQWGVVKTDAVRMFGLETGDGGVLDSLGLDEAARAHLRRTSGFYKGRRLSNDKVVPTDQGSFFDYIAGKERPKARIAAVWHLFHFDLLQPMLQYLERIPYPCDIFVSLADAENMGPAVKYISSAANRLYLYNVENRGRDMKPFLDLLATHELDEYNCVLKIHSKKSEYSQLGEDWRDTLLTSLVPSIPAVRRIVDAFVCDSTLGIVSSFQSFVSSHRYMGGNWERIQRFGLKMGLSAENIPLFFVAGSMFWFNPRALVPFLNALRGEAFEDERGQLDGTLAHAMERLTCLSSLSLNLRCSPIEDLSARLTPADVQHNSVKVLN